MQAWRSPAAILLALALTAATLALATAYATGTLKPPSGLASLASSSTSQAVNIAIVKPLKLHTTPGAQAVYKQTQWLKITRQKDVDTVTLTLSLKNINQLKKYFDYLEISIIEAKNTTTIQEKQVTKTVPEKHKLDYTLYYTDRKQCTGQNKAELDLTLNGTKLEEKLVDVLKTHVGLPASEAERQVKELVSQAAIARITVFNDTNPARQVLFNNSVSRLADLVRNNIGFTFGASTYNPYDKRYYITFYEDDQWLRPEYLVWISPFAIAQAPGNNRYWPEPGHATNYTLILDFFSSNGSWLFGVKWVLRWHHDPDNTNCTDVYNKLNIYEYLASVYWVNKTVEETITVPVVVVKPGEVKALLGFDTRTGWMKPRARITIDGNSWGFDHGRSVIYGVVVAYEAREGVMADNLPIIIGIRVVGSS